MGLDTIEILKILPAAVIGLTVHEFSHAFAAYKLGDDTAKKEGRLTKIINIKEYRLHAVAACVFFTCSAGIIKKTTGYNKQSNFRKTYIIQNERK